MSGPVTVTQADLDMVEEVRRLGWVHAGMAFALHRQQAEATSAAQVAALVEALENLANAARATPRFASPMLLAEADKALARAKASSDGEGVGP